MPSIMKRSFQLATEVWAFWIPKASSPPKAPATAAKPVYIASLTPISPLV